MNKKSQLNRENQSNERTLIVYNVFYRITGDRVVHTSYRVHVRFPRNNRVLERNRNERFIARIYFSFLFEEYW